MADRPVSLNIPDVIEGQSAMNWIMLILARNPLLLALYDYGYTAGAQSTSRTIDAKERNLVAALEALPTFAPAIRDALTIPDHFDGQSPTHWVTLLLGHNPLLGALYDYACAVEKGAPEAVIVNRRDRLIAVADTFAAPPTKPPREMPAPEWTGPDMYQTWYARYDYRPETSGDAACPAGFVPIGPWEPRGVTPGSGAGDFRDWRRPLRRVSHV